MKLTIVTYAAIIAATTSAHAATVHAGILNYWTLDGDANDTAGSLSGNASTVADNGGVAGTAGAATIASSGGLFGGAATFERDVSTDGRVAIPDSADVSFSGENLTTSLWLDFDNTGSRWQAILGKGESDDYRFSSHNNSNNAAYAGGTGDINSGVNIRDGNWHHIVATTTEGGATQIYVDGALAGTNAGPASTGSGNRMWDGRIDDVAQWGRVLTPEEVSEIYDAGVAGVSLGEIPEPSSTLLLGLSGLMLTIRRRR